MKTVRRMQKLARTRMQSEGTRLLSSEESNQNPPGNGLGNAPLSGHSHSGGKILFLALK
jgi:hypothetical protein